MNEELRKIFESYCYRCVHFESPGGVCTKIHENIKIYPKKFFAKCNRQYFILDPDKELRLKVKSRQSNHGDNRYTPEFLDEPMYHVNLLIGYGKVISILGWLCLAVGVFLLIGFFFNNGDINYSGDLPMIMILSGIGMIVSGQFVLCLVSIERNTKRTIGLLKKIAD